jgi:hypothetical protein
MTDDKIFPPTELYRRRKARQRADKNNASSASEGTAHRADLPMTPELAGMKATFAQWGIDVKFVPANYTLPDDF